MNKKKKKNLVLSLFLLILLVGFNGIMIVAGKSTCPGGVCGNGETAGTGSIPQCSNYCWDILGAGVRITIVNKEGEAQTTPKDFMGNIRSEQPPCADSKYKNCSTTVFKGEGVSKKDVTANYEFTNYSNQSAANFVTVPGGQDSNTWYLNDSLFQSGTVTHIGKGDKISSYYHKSLKYLQDTYKVDPTKAFEEIDKLLGVLGWTGPKVAEMTQEQRENLYIQYEPVVLSREMLRGVNYRQFYGTITEYANMDGTYEYNSLGMHHIKALDRKWTVKWFGTGIDVGANDEGDQTWFQPVTQKLNDGDGDWKVVKDNPKTGYAVAHIWLGSFDSAAQDCEFILEEVIHKNPALYVQGVDGGKYDEAITAIRSGNTDYPFETADKKVYKIDRSEGYTYNMLKKEKYKQGRAACLDKPDDPKNCGKPATVSIDPCESGINMYSDSAEEEEWLECGVAYLKDQKYTSENTGHESTDGDKVGNPEYCRLYCYEKVTTTFPTKVEDVKASQTFVWGIDDSGTFGEVKVTKNCSTRKRAEGDDTGRGTEGYLYGKWEDEYKANAKTLVDNFIKANAATEASKKENITTSSSSCKCNCYPCGTITNPQTCCDTCYSGTASSSFQLTNKPDGSPSTELSTGSSTTAGNWAGSTTQTVSSSKTTACVYASATEAQDVALGLVQSDYQTNYINPSNAAYGNANTQETELLKKIQQCTKNLKYNYATTVTLVFKEPVNGAYGEHERHKDDYYDDDAWKMLADKGDSAEIAVQTTSENGCVKRKVPTYNCNPGSNKDASCTATMQEVWDCKQITWKLDEETWTYSYSTENFMWYSLKKNSKLENTKNLPDDIEPEYYYSVGFGLPTAFTLPSGMYKISVVVENIGDTTVSPDTEEPSDYNSPNGHFGPVLEDTENGGKGFEYICTYEVDNEIFGYDCEYLDGGGALTSESPLYCDVSKDDDPFGELIGIDVAYRLVNLLDSSDHYENAFLAPDGGPRVMGENWNKVAGDINDILRNTIYTEDPMYEIFLSSKTIQDIRDDSNIEKHGGNDNYASLDNVVCAGDDDVKYCASDYVSQLYGDGILVGTCLPNSDTKQRAEEVLQHGCNGSYTPLTYSWKRG